MGNPLLSQQLNIMSSGVSNHSSSINSNSMKKKTVYFIRHGEALHNVTGDYSIPDPKLTQEGVRQALRIKNAIPAQSLANIGLILTSPLKRTVQTTLLAFNRHIEWQGVPVKLMADLQETGNHPCDTGSSASDLSSEFTYLRSEIEGLPIGWNEKKGAYEASEEKLRDRALRMLKWISDRPEDLIVIVCHNGFLKYLIGNELWTDNGRTVNGFKNGEVRRFKIGVDGIVCRDDQVLLGSLSNPIIDEMEAVGYLD